MTKLIEQTRRKIEAIPPRLYATLAVLTMLLVACIIMFYTMHVVYITDSNGDEQMFITVENDTDTLLSMAGFSVSEYDEVFHTSYSGNIENLNIQRAMTINVEMQDETVITRLGEGTVKSALENAGVTLSEYDYTEPSLNTVLSDKDEIVVHRVEYQDTNVPEVVPYETVYKESSLLHLSRFRNKSYVLQEGRDGENTLTYRQRIVDGELESEQLVATTQVSKPIQEVVLVYGAGAPVSSVPAPSGVSVTNNVPSQYSRVLTNAVATAYSSKGGRGSSGLGLYYGTVAVNPNVIPYGTKMYITAADGSFVYGWAIATDTGTALNQGIIDVDLYYETYIESVLNEKKLLNIYIM